jgi:hypothetical protein
MEFWTELALRQRKNAVAPVATNINPTMASNAHIVEFDASRIVESSPPMQTAHAKACDVCDANSNVATVFVSVRAFINLHQLATLFHEPESIHRKNGGSRDESVNKSFVCVIFETPPGDRCTKCHTDQNEKEMKVTE